MSKVASLILEFYSIFCLECPIFVDFFFTADINSVRRRIAFETSFLLPTYWVVKNFWCSGKPVLVLKPPEHRRKSFLYCDFRDGDC